MMKISAHSFGTPFSVPTGHTQKQIFTILHPPTIHFTIPTGMDRPEAQIGPLLSGYLLRSSLVNWAKAPATNSSKSLGHVPARRVWRSQGSRFGGGGFHTKVTMESQQQTECREREREQSSFSNEVKNVRLKYSQMKGWMIYLVISDDDLTGLQGLQPQWNVCFSKKKCRAFRREFLQGLVDYDLEHVLQELYWFHTVICWRDLRPCYTPHLFSGSFDFLDFDAASWNWGILTVEFQNMFRSMDDLGGDIRSGNTRRTIEVHNFCPPVSVTNF